MGDIQLLYFDIDRTGTPDLEDDESLNAMSSALTIIQSKAYNLLRHLRSRQKLSTAALI